MTAAVAYHVPGVGCVLACDSRAACTETGHVFTDEDQKWALLGSLTVVCAGTPGALWLDLRTRPPRNMDALRKRIAAVSSDDDKLKYEFLVYDQRTDWLAYLDDGGDAISIGRRGAIGAGGPLSMGVMDAARAPQTLDAAARLTRRAVAIACRRNAFCGGRVRTVVVSRKGAVVLR